MVKKKIFSKLLEQFRDIDEAYSSCHYCNASKKHAWKHGNDPRYVLCTAHRAIQSVTGNSYVFDYNVADRNPYTATKHCYTLVEAPERELDLEQFPFVIIAVFPAIKPDYHDITLYPLVVADIDGRGEYVNRRRVVVFKCDDKFGILDENAGFGGIFCFLGARFCFPLVETNTILNADVPEFDAHFEFNYVQRESCEQCK